MPCAGARSPASASSAPNAPRSSAEVDRLRRGADDRHAGRLEPPGQAERGLPAELHDDADHARPAGRAARAVLGVADLEHVLERERLEVEPVGGVVVGRHGLRVAVDHHGLVAGRRAAPSPRARTSSRTRCPARSGSARSRGSAPWAGPTARPRSPRRRTSSGTGSSRRTRPRRCRPSCRPAAARAGGAACAPRPRRRAPGAARRSAGRTARPAWPGAAAARRAPARRRSRPAGRPARRSGRRTTGRYRRTPPPPRPPMAPSRSARSTV